MYYARKRLVHFAKRLLGLKYVPDRYAPMYQEIAREQPRTILEIGTNDGLNAVRMVRLTNAEYFGFDLFEQLDRAAFLREFALHPPSKIEVQEHLRRSGVTRFHLFAGDTRMTLPQAALPKMDLIFIDGGHSEQTVASDWENCHPLMHDRTVVYFDDYPNWGIGPVVDRIKGFAVEIMPEFDEFRDPSGKSRRFQLARVTPEHAAELH